VAAGREPLSLAALLAEAEAKSPEILALRARRSAAEHLPAQMEALPDPTASVSYTNDTVSRFTLGSSEFSTLTFSWLQELPYPGKRRLAGDVARAEIALSDRSLETARLRVRAAVKRAYVELFRIDRTRTILDESRKLLVSFLETARARYETGEGILENVLKAQTELMKIDGEIAALAQERRAAELQIGALLGRSADVRFGPALAAPRLEATEAASLERNATERSPDLLELRAASQREESRLSLARQNLKPDFQWGAAYMNRGGLDPMVMGMFGFRLPLHKKQKQSEAVAQAELELEAARRDIERGEVRLLSEVRERITRAERARTLVQLYGEGILPQARSALDSAAASYGVGKAEFVTLIGDFLSVLEAEKEYEAQRAQEAMVLAELEPLTGATLLLPAEGGEGDSASGGPHE